MLKWSKSLMRLHQFLIVIEGDANLGTPGQVTVSVSGGVNSDLSISLVPASYPERDNNPLRRLWLRIRRRGSSRRRLRTQASGKSVWRHRPWKRTRSSTRGGTRTMTPTSSPTDTPLRPRQSHTSPASVAPKPPQVLVRGHTGPVINKLSHTQVRTIPCVIPQHNVSRAKCRVKVQDA